MFIECTSTHVRLKTIESQLTKLVDYHQHYTSEQLNLSGSSPSMDTNNAPTVDNSQLPVSNSSLHFTKRLLIFQVPQALHLQRKKKEVSVSLT